MTRTEIDSALAALVGLAANPPTPRGDSYLIAALARVVANQEQRLRVLEPCVERVAGAAVPHVWGYFEASPDAITCCYCHITKEPPSAPPVAEHPVIALLREIEWSGNEWTESPTCPACGGKAPSTTGETFGDGVHAPDCKLAALIKEGAR